MIGVLAVGVVMVLIVSSAYLVLGKHLVPPAAGRPFGAVAPSLWRHCPRCARAEFVLAPGGRIPPCPCLTPGDTP